MLNSIGLANPGLDVVEREELPWLGANLQRARVLLSVVGNTVDDYVAVVARLTDYPVLTAFELNLSCPNTDRGGEHFGADDAVLADLVRRCKAVARRPIIAKLAPTLPNLARSAGVAAQAGADGFAVVNTIPGTLFREPDGAGARKPCLGAGFGGVSGPLLLPVGLLATQRVSGETGLPVIGVGGVRSPADVQAYLDAGATLVAVGTAALADPHLPERLVLGLRDG
jgi:dihydroorotate dehydrogenase (NAD+) catalytic subunit